VRDAAEAGDHRDDYEWRPRVWNCRQPCATRHTAAPRNPLITIPGPKIPPEPPEPIDSDVAARARGEALLTSLGAAPV
jgi:hypothetical protein